MNRRITALLENVRAGRLTVADAMEALGTLPFDDLDFARFDTQRSLRTGFPEVIYAPGKTVEQITAIAARALAADEFLMVTRAGADVHAALARLDKRARYYEQARIVAIGRWDGVAPETTVAVATGGTSDLPVAEEAAVTAELAGARVLRVFDVGVAGLPRLLSQLASLRAADAVIVVAGMEGALAGVVAGLVAAPVIAVPTSVGYGAGFSGLAPLLSMLNACAPGVAVVNIDNGFGAGYLAALMHRRRTPQ